MPRAKKNVTAASNIQDLEKPAQNGGQRAVASGQKNFASDKSSHEKNGQRKRGWRDIEAMSERARLKNMLVDIWHEDIELDEDIFGESDHLSGFYTDFEEVEIEIEPAEDEDADDFEGEED